MMKVCQLEPLPRRVLDMTFIMIPLQLSLPIFKEPDWFKGRSGTSDWLELKDIDIRYSSMKVKHQTL